MNAVGEYLVHTKNTTYYVISRGNDDVELHFTHKGKERQLKGKLKMPIAVGYRMMVDSPDGPLTSAVASIQMRES